MFSFDSGLRVRPSVLAVLAFSSLAAAAQTAQTPRAGLDPVLVTATRAPLRLDQVLADVTVLTRADIERQGFGNLADLLSRQACVEMVRNGTPGSTTSLFVRGANTQHTLLLVDGVRVDTQSGSGGAPWEAIPLAQIERIEIVRGAASAIYGSDAVAAVIQIFTRKGQGAPHGEASLSMGSLGLSRGELSVSGAHESLDFSLGLTTETADGFNNRKVAPTPSYEPDLDGWEQNTVQGRFGWQLNKAQRLEWQGSWADLNSAYDATAKPKAGVDDRNLHRTQLQRLRWASDWTAGVQSEFSAGQSNERYETQTNGATTYLTETAVRQLALQGSWRLPVGQLNGLLERREDRLTNSSLRTAMHGQAERHQDAVGLSYLLNVAHWDAQLHARHDRDSEFGGVNTGTAALGWRMAEGWRSWVSGGSAFRAPTLYQVFSEYGPKAGQAALQPERGRNRELGLSWTGADSSVSLTAYNNRVRQLISWDASFVGHCDSAWGCYGNLAAVLLRGVSLQGETVLAGLRLQGGLDWQDPRDQATDKRLGRRAKQLARLSVHKDWQAWSLGAQVQAQGARFDDHANTRPLGGYALLNLDLGYRVNAQTRVQVNLDNALNKDYETAKGYAQAGRTLRVSARLSF